MEPGGFVDRYLLGKELTQDEKDDIRNGLAAIANGGTLGGCGQRQGFNLFNPANWIVSSAYASEISCYIVQADGSHIELGIKACDDCKDAIYAYLNSLSYEERIDVLRSAGFGTRTIGNNAIGEAVFLTNWLLSAIDRMDGKLNGFYYRQFTDGYIDSYNLGEDKKLELRANLADPSLSFDQKAQQLEAAGIDIHAMMAAAMLGAAAKGRKIWSSKSTMSSVENALDHWNKHQKEFPEIKNAKRYAEKANSFVNDPPVGTFTKNRPNGDKMYYDPSSNTFAVATKDGEPRTMFRPTDGMNYWNRQ